MQQATNNLDLLLIEDNPADAWILKEMLETTSLNIGNLYEAERIEEACRLIESKNISLVLLDLSLPDSSGLNSFLTLQRAANKIPVIILTSLSDTDMALRAIHAGAKDYLVKGEINKNVLIRAIQYTLERRKLEKELEQQQKIKLQQITAATLAAQERERTYIGEELHDNINQILTSVKLYISTAISQPEMRDDLLDRAHSHLTLVMEEIRKLSKKLISPGMKTGGLSELLRNVIDDITLASPVIFNVDINLDENLLKEEQKIAVYRIIQEQINNILKHSQATEVSIQLYMNDEKLTIITTDNGRGFDFAEIRNGIGITNMISRAEMFNGIVEIDTAPGKGCCIKTELYLSDISHNVKNNDGSRSVY